MKKKAQETKAKTQNPVKEVTVTEAKGRPMLRWVGKKPLTRLPVFPAQLVETFIPKGAEKDESNLLFHGDNKEVLSWLLANGYRGKVDLIYIDPPFDSGADYVRKVQLRGENPKNQIEGYNYTLGEQIQYTDIWTNDNYLQYMYERLQLLKELLSERGSIYVHCDWHRVHLLRCILDEIFGQENFLNEIIWCYTGPSGADEFFPRKHDNILFYRRGQKGFFNQQRMRHKSGVHNTGQVFGDSFRNDPLIKETLEQAGKKIEDWWVDIWATDRYRSELIGYPTQKPVALLERIIQTSSQNNDIVLDCFAGSGTSICVAQKLGRRWIGCDINKGAIQTTCKRLQKIIDEQMQEAHGKIVAPEIKPVSRSFAVYRVNDYDLQIQHNEALELAVEHIGITRTKEDSFFEGTLGNRLVKIVPLQHPCTLLDLQLVQDELKKRVKEERDIVIVCLGKEAAVDAKVETWNKLHPINKLSIIELRTDRKYGKFFEHKPCKAAVKFARKEKKLTVEITDFLSPTIIERLKSDAGVLQPKIEDWRSMVDSVQIDTEYDGKVFNIHLTDVPEKKTDLVQGSYALELPNEKKRTVAVKITDMLGEEVLIEKEV